MERIKQALERAKQEQFGGRNVANLTMVSNGFASPSLPDIVYTQTKVHRPSAAKLKKNRIVCGENDLEATTAYNILRTHLLQRMAAEGWSTLAITSPEPDQGKTLTAINLAVSIARDKHRTVLLVDFDMRRPSIHRYFDYVPEHGIDDYFLRNVPLDDILVHPSIDRLVILPGKRAVDASSETLASVQMGRLVNELKNRYKDRFIIFDLPPVLRADDVVAFAPHVDSVLMVIEDTKTGKEELTHAMDLLKEVNVIGTVLNKSSDVVGTYY